MHFRLISIILVVLCLSCNREPGQLTIVEGRVTDSQGRALPATTVSIFSRPDFDLSSLAFGGTNTSKKLDETIVNADGTYEYVFFNELRELHFVSLSETDSISCTERKALELGEKNTVNLVASKKVPLFEYTVIHQSNTQPNELEYEYLFVNKKCKDRIIPENSSFEVLSDTSTRFSILLPQFDSIGLDIRFYEDGNFIGRDSFGTHIRNEITSRTGQF